MVGRLNTETGESKVETSPTPKANPYGMVVTTKGVPYFVEFGANKIASIDPETMAIHEYLLPNESARPRRVAITPDDVLYYTDYGRGYLGEFDAKTGKFVKEWLSPSGPQSRPYGITIVNGIVWYSEAGVKPNTLVRFDPKTEKFQTWTIPSGGGVVRNMMHFADGKLVLTESGENVVALVTVKGGKQDGDGREVEDCCGACFSLRSLVETLSCPAANGFAQAKACATTSSTDFSLWISERFTQTGRARQTRMEFHRPKSVLLERHLRVPIPLSQTSCLNAWPTAEPDPDSAAPA